MTNLIPITKNEIGNTELNSVNDREIHSYYKLAMALLIKHFPIKLSEKTIQRHLNKLRDAR